ncbi:MAG: RsbRD N-terminal domain-containing protein [Acidobacteriota bacterium]
MLNISSEQRLAIADEWLALTLETYPSQSMRFLLHETDCFRNPVGKTLKDGIPLLVGELFGDMKPDRVAQALESIVRIRAVQNFTAREAVGFVFLLKGILQREFQGDWAVCYTLCCRVDEMAMTAFDMYVQCRGQIYDIQVNEARRRVALLEKIYSQAEGR